MRVPVAAAVALLLAVPLAVSGVPASAATCTAPELVSASVAPRTVVVGISVPKGFVLTAQVRSNGCAVAHVDTAVVTPTGASTSFAMSAQETTDGVTAYDVGVRVDPGAVGNADAGTWTSAVTISWAGSAVRSVGPRVRVLRAARLSTNATPEPLPSGEKLTVRGTLTLAGWATLRYQALAGRHVELQVRPTDFTRYRRVRTATSDSSGRVRSTLHPTRDACYRWVYRGSTGTAKVVAKPDCVDVR